MKINYNGMELEEVTTPQIFDPPKPRRATNRELARWLAQGNGEWVVSRSSDAISSDFLYHGIDSEKPVDDTIVVRKWSDTEWNEPMVDFLFGGDDAEA